MSKNVDNCIAEDVNRLTPAQERLLGFVTAQCVKTGCVRLAKSELALRMGCCVRTVDRAVRRLRDEGYLEVEPLFDEDGGQVVNEYRVAGLIGGFSGVSVSALASADSEIGGLGGAPVGAEPEGRA